MIGVGGESCNDFGDFGALIPKIKNDEGEDLLLKALARIQDVGGKAQGVILRQRVGVGAHVAFDFTDDEDAVGHKKVPKVTSA
jgi:hypothetical protein